MPAREAITGLVLAGGQGRRMGGLDKGLQRWQGAPLAQHALHRLLPQVGTAAISVNRHVAEYRMFGVPVWTDTVPGFAGPLAGWLAGLRECATPYLVSVPCDTPGFPPDLVTRLGAALDAAGARIAIATTAQRPQPVFCLMERGLAADLERFLARGERQVLRWVAEQHGVEALFNDEAAFRNCNTLADLDSA